jgi:hypothetical protein
MEPRFPSERTMNLVTNLENAQSLAPFPPVCVSVHHVNNKMQNDFCPKWRTPLPCIVHSIYTKNLANKSREYVL